MKARVIALYLPQFHPTPNNNKWWGEGFTEWTNVGKAKKLFPGHYQPKVPADLGYYDLRLPQVRQAQADMARQAGIDGFCYYHYWFDTNRQELELPFEQVLASGEPDFPFMLCWANENWHAKFWNLDGTVDKKLLVEQKYGEIEEYTAHFNYLLPAFSDSRYMRYNNKPMFMIYKPMDISNVTMLIELWNKLAWKNGLDGIHFIGQTIHAKTDIDQILLKNFDAVNYINLYKPIVQRTFSQKVVDKIRKTILPRPFTRDYRNVCALLSETCNKDNTYPTLIPNWDHTPRSGKGGYVLTNSTPDNFGKHVKSVLDHIADKPEQDKIVFLKSWNEWGEGNYMEPDLKYGKGYIETLKKALE